MRLPRRPGAAKGNVVKVQLRFSVDHEEDIHVYFLLCVWSFDWSVRILIQPSLETQGQIVGRTESLGERRNDGRGGGSGEKRGGKGQVPKSAPGSPRMPYSGITRLTAGSCYRSNELK